MSEKMTEKLKYKIYIDTSDRFNSSISLFENSLDKNILLEKKEGQIDVISEISKILKRRKLNLNEVEIESNLGPGSFTGLRIGVTISNILNWVLGRKEAKDLEYPAYGSEPNITPPKKFKL